MGAKKKHNKQAINFKLKTTQGVCAPHAAENYAKHKSCLSLEELKSLAALYNKYEGDKNKHIPLTSFNDFRALYNELNDRYKSRGCDDGAEQCWIKQHRYHISPDVMNKFRPIMPETWKQNEREWLSTFDILNVMKQYELYDKTFKFMGVFPVDFNQKIKGGMCVVNEMCNFTVKDFLSSKKYTKFGVVFNLDRHDQPGSHWVCAFVNFTIGPQFGLCYYDSAGRRPPKYIFAFLKQIRDEAATLYPKEQFEMFKGKFNPKQHQFKNTECGVFCMVYIILCLENPEKSYIEIRSLIGSHGKNADDFIFRFREQLYIDTY